MSDIELTPEYDTTYKKNLESQIALKKRLLKAAEKQLEMFRQQNTSDSSKVSQIALTDTLAKVPFRPPRNDLIGLSLAQNNLSTQLEAINKTLAQMASSNKELQSRADDMANTNVVFDILKTELEERIQQEMDKKQQLLSHTVGDDIKDAYLQKQAKLVDRSTKLIEISKKLIVDYILRKEFEALFTEEELDERKQKFLKLLEILLNNSITSTGNSKLLEVDNKDDPLIRYLILNNIIVADPKNPNKIKLRDLATNL
ncbi:hypothetical protein KL918_003259 [Ogataea parapolymorpha]|uniref:Uncharacterized protein n=1 Tax=Ogataea parapolymorpha (strain ATCC 26012 / BCRC 20466 / JCM 22074 / NRRL Y-7560 / DL-1) TaxID=871575 RepID=W1QAN1_OGAPD|nr:hypothetical protein HPODL_01954 [Ogataea parapolymorpha DL-1]ESW97876.1 hypothetical protein HPODL_01954 [Ogataea parapolymorpha DL-1]KAG7867064.1 hypothetical protein KL918_003259 [Ogataea parapolymorpha]KAG7872428.1 hypothetical protein KL916_003163 [Ogataea parapolymorpha]